MAHNPVVGTGTYFASANGISTSQAFSAYSDSLRITSVGTQDINVSIGTAVVTKPPTDLDYVILADTSETLSIEPRSSKVVGISTGTTTQIHFPEGTGCAFKVGDTVSLVGLTPTTLNFTHQPVESILTSAAPQDGRYSTRCVINWNSVSATVSGASTVSFASTATLRNSYKVSAKAGGTGSNIYLQQVQVSGDS